MSFARIFRPAKTAMQSGHGNSTEWVLEFEQTAPQTVEALTGWTSGADNLANQVRLSFATREEAVAYAKARDLPFQVMDAPAARPIPRAYSDNFAFRRRLPWTH